MDRDRLYRSERPPKLTVSPAATEVEAVKWRDQGDIYVNQILDLANSRPVGVPQGRVQGTLRSLVAQHERFAFWYIFCPSVCKTTM